METTIDYGIRPPDFRMPETMRMGRVRLQVADLDRSLAFYRDLLGFRLVDRDGSTVRLGAVQGDEILVELQAKPGVRPVSRRSLLGLYHFAVLLPDRASLGRLIAHLTGHGVQAGMSDHFVSEAIYLTDPDGLGLEIYSDRPRPSWRQTDAQLYMETKPLDVRSLIEAAAGIPWGGMPSGTRIGHIHLHVGELEPAKKFYHQGLGLDLIVWSYPGALFMSAGGYHHHLGTNTWAAGAPSATDADARLLDWEVVVPSHDDALAAAESVKESGGVVEILDHGARRAIDPWGTAVRITVL